MVNPVQKSHEPIVKPDDYSKLKTEKDLFFNEKNSDRFNFRLSKKLPRGKSSSKSEFFIFRCID